MKSYEELESFVEKHKLRASEKASRTSKSATIQKDHSEVDAVREEALTKIAQLKRYIKDLLGWEISVKDEIIELKNVNHSVTHPDTAVVLRLNEQTASYEILDTKFSQELFQKHKNLDALVSRSLPVLFSYVNVILRPELADLYYIA